MFGKPRQVILVIGEAPSKYMDQRGFTKPLLLASRDLAELAGLRWPKEWEEVVEVRNVLDKFPGRQLSGKGDLFPIWEAQSEASKMSFEGYPRVVLLGRRVGSAFGLSGDWFCWTTFKGTSVAVAPHPSKVSHWWNSKENVEAARQFWRLAVQ